MDRTIKFRGKRLDNGEWVYGDLEYIPKTNLTRIHTCDKDGNYDRDYIVDSNTVGQFTGMFDKDGLEVYEGDIVMSLVTFPDEDEYINDFWRVGEIRYSANSFCLTTCTNYDNQEMTEKSVMQPSKESKHNFPTHRSRVIGNIHDSIRPL